MGNNQEWGMISPRSFDQRSIFAFFDPGATRHMSDQKGFFFKPHTHRNREVVRIR